MSETCAIERNGLVAVEFDRAAMLDHMGRRLAAAGLSHMVEEMEALGAERAVFVQAPLTADQVRAVNSAEALAVAAQAGVFQERIAQVGIVESFESLDNLRDVAGNQKLPWTFSTVPYHEACGEWAGRQRLFWTRQGLTAALVGLSGELAPAEFGLHYEDGYRPLGVQEGLFKRRYQMAGAAHPEWNHDERLLEACSKTAYTPRFASHKGGAAVDVRVRDMQTGGLVDIGHNYPDGGATVAMQSPFVTQSQWENRMLLAIPAAHRGLTLYPFEDWHACRGDTTAAACSPEDIPPASQYGPIKTFDLRTGRVLEAYAADELDTVFAYED